MTVPRKEKDSVDGENKQVSNSSRGNGGLLLLAIVKIWGYRNVGLEKHNGRLSYLGFRPRKWSFFLRSL